MMLRSDGSLSSPNGSLKTAANARVRLPNSSGSLSKHSVKFHQRSLNVTPMFQHGLTVREIAESEGVDERQIYLSISRCETRLPRAEVMTNRNFRNAMVAQRKLAEKYTQTLSDLMDGKGGKNWSQRSKALQHFQRTVGMDPGGGGVSVNVHQQAVIQNTNPRSFEEAMDRVRLQHAKAAQERTVSIESGSPK